MVNKNPIPIGDKLCPRCKQVRLYKDLALNALSRRDNDTYICSDCGTAEAMEDYITKGRNTRNDPKDGGKAYGGN